MSNIQTLNRNHEMIAWGVVFIWWGIAILLTLLKFVPNGIDAVGIGLILLGLNVARSRKGISTNEFSITIGILALLWGIHDLMQSVLHLPFVPALAILLIVLGVILLVRELFRVRKTDF